MKNQANVVIHKGCHSRTPLSGIYNARRYQIQENALLNRYVEDPRVLRTAKSGMTLHLIPPHPALRATLSKEEVLVYNPLSPLLGTFPTRGTEQVALCA